MSQEPPKPQPGAQPDAEANPQADVQADAQADARIDSQVEAQVEQPSPKPDPVEPPANEALPRPGAQTPNAPAEASPKSPPASAPEVPVGRETRRPASTAAPAAAPEPQPAPSPRRRPNRLLQAFGILVLIGIAAVAGAALYLRYQLSPASTMSVPVEFEVQPGWGATRVAAELERAGIIRDARIFVLLLRYRQLDRTIGEGLYDLDPAMSAAAIAERLAAGGRPRTVRVVIPEGYRATEVAQRLEEAGLGDAASYLELIRNPGELRPAFVPEGVGLEGYLFPASYDIPVGSTPAEVLGQMLERFAQEIDGDVVEALAALNLDVHQWVTLASMIQAEAGDASEMPIIAGVFLNRLDEGMLLQSDPTVAYGLGKSLPELDAPAGDFDQDHPWNTYTRGGLPPSPIGNPGREALRAVFAAQRLDDAGNAYLYFLHGVEDGAPVFRPNTSLDDHNRDVDRYLR